MTNAMIIMHESVRLMEEGVLKGTGEFVKVENADGTTTELEMPEAIHTFNGWKERVKLMSKNYRYNSKLVQTIKCNYIPWPEDRGYEALNGVMYIAEGQQAADVLVSSSEKSNIEQRKLMYLQKFIDVCKAHDIKLVMCYSPYYGQSVPKSIRMIQHIAEEKDVLFLNYGDDVRFQKSEYFQDASQLNDTGAKEYSMEVVSRFIL